MSHALKMLLGCLIPIALIFILPLLGFGQDFTLFAFIVLMFACHLFMMPGHRHKNGHNPPGGGDHRE